MIRVLLLGVGGNVSQGILKAIRRSGMDVWVLGACISPMSTGLYMCDAALVSPYANEETFIPWVIKVCNEQKIDMIMTGVEENILALSKAADVLQRETKAIFIASDYEMLRIGQDKLLTVQWLKESGCEYPKYAELSDKTGVHALIEEVGFPLIIKPRSGKSAAGVHKIEDADELAAFSDLSDYVVEECLGSEDEEYTVGCYCDKNGVLRDVIVMKRALKHGTTMYAKVVHSDVIRKEAEKICAAFKPHGPINIQLRLTKDGRAVPFELNVRFSGSTAMRSMFGYEDVKAMLKEYVLGEEIDDCFKIRMGEAFRYDAEMYVFDDSVDEMIREQKLDGIDDRRAKRTIVL